MKLIDKDALMEDINESLREMTIIGIAVDGDWLWAKLNDAIEHAPTIEERKKGKWNCGDDMFEYAICSACKWDSGEAWEYAKNYFRYCPNCGADMRERREE